MINFKKFISLKLIILLFGGQINLPIKSSNNDLIIGVAATGSVLLAGIAAYKLYYNSNYYYKNVIDKSIKVYNRLINYDQLIKVIDQNYTLSGKSDSDKRMLASRINEKLLLEIAFYHVLDIDRYITDLLYNLDDLKACKKSLNKISNKLKLNLEVINLCNDASKLAYAFSELLPKIHFLYIYLDTHRSYFKLYELGNRIAKEFKEDLDVLMSNIEPNIVEDLKKFVRIKNHNSSYPYLNYVEHLTKNINILHNISFSLVYSNLLKEIQILKNNLTKIRTYIVGDPEYFLEKRRFDQDRERQEKIRLDQAFKSKDLELKQQKQEEERKLKQKEIELKERKLKEERELREREIRIKELEYQARFQNRNCTC